MIATQFIDQGFPVQAVLSAVDLSRSVYYYKPSNKVKGKRRSTHTRKLSGDLVSNDEVVKQIKEELEQEFVDYGYVKMTYFLRDEYSYIINEKKVYLLMKENNLLYKPRGRNKSGKTWVQDLVPSVSMPFTFWEFDIKYMWIAGERRNAMLLTILDVVTRYTMGQILEWSIKKEDVRDLFGSIFQRYQLPESITVRNDNGSQFAAKLVREYLKEMDINQEFCRPATPEQNGHIESYHSIVERSICRRFAFATLGEAQATMKRFDTFYCDRRIHSGIGYTSPTKYALRLGVNGKYLCKSGEAEAGSAGEQPARNIQMAIHSTCTAGSVVSGSADMNELPQMPQKTQQSIVEYRSSL